MNEIMKTLVEHAGRLSIEKTDDLLGKLIQPDQYIGHLFGMSYGDALVQVHDNDRKRTGGIPGLSFLVASRRPEGANFDNEDASVLLVCTENLIRVDAAMELPKLAE
jgi:hypothetical protein